MVADVLPIFAQARAPKPSQENQIFLALSYSNCRLPTWHQLAAFHSGLVWIPNMSESGVLFGVPFFNIVNATK